MVVELQEVGGFVEGAALLLAAVVLDVAELLEGFWNWRERRWPCMPKLARAR